MVHFQPGRANPGTPFARPRKAESALSAHIQAPRQIAVSSDKQSGVGDVKALTHPLLWLAPSLCPYVDTAPRKSKGKSSFAPQLPQNEAARDSLKVGA